MRMSVQELCAAALFLISLPAGAEQRVEASDRLDVDISIFYEELAPHGEWIEHDTYGWTWTPRGVAVDWRPYSDGHWVYAEEYGWTWVSDWEWGWAPFHYGRWAFDPRYGWLWVPGTEWAPAWVSWRTGEGHIGWAPLPPEVSWNADVGLDFGSVSVSASLGTSVWSFVDERVFAEPRIQRYIVLPDRTATLFPHTHNSTRYVAIAGGIANLGIDVRYVERAAGTRVQRVRLRDAEPTIVRREGTRIRGDELVVFRPRVSKTAVKVTPKGFRAVQRNLPDRTQEDLRFRRRDLRDRNDMDRSAIEPQEGDRKQIQRGRALDLGPDEFRKYDVEEYRAWKQRQGRQPRGAGPDNLQRPGVEERRVLDDDQQRQRRILERREQGEDFNEHRDRNSAPGERKSRKSKKDKSREKDNEDEKR